VKFDSVDFMNICSENPRLVKIRQKMSVNLREDVNALHCCRQYYIVTTALSSNSLYQAFRRAEKIQTLCERVRMLRYTHVANSYSKCINGL
jgi:hypothetical protein